MKVQGVNNNLNLQNFKGKEKTETATKPNQNGKNGKKIALALAGLATLAVGAVAIAKLKNTHTHNLKTYNLKDITFEKGKPMLNGKYISNYGSESTIEGKLKNGDNIILKYKDGKLIESKRTGSVNIEKIFEDDPFKGRMITTCTEKEGDRTVRIGYNNGKPIIFYDEYLENPRTLESYVETLDEFKKNGGYFRKGEAYSGGRRHTGYITVGDKKLEFINGFLLGSSSPNHFSKCYNYNNRLRLDSVETYPSYPNKGPNSEIKFKYNKGYVSGFEHRIGGKTIKFDNTVDISPKK